MGAMSSLRRFTGGLFGVGRCTFLRGVLMSLPADAPAPAPDPPPPAPPAPPACARANVVPPARNAAVISVVASFMTGLLRGFAILNNRLPWPSFPQWISRVLPHCSGATVVMH